MVGQENQTHQQADVQKQGHGNGSLFGRFFVEVKQTGPLPLPPFVLHTSADQPHLVKNVVGIRLITNALSDPLFAGFLFDGPLPITFGRMEGFVGARRRYH